MHCACLLVLHRNVYRRSMKLWGYIQFCCFTVFLCIKFYNRVRYASLMNYNSAWICVLNLQGAKKNVEITEIPNILEIWYARIFSLAFRIKMLIRSSSHWSTRNNASFWDFYMENEIVTPAENQNIKNWSWKLIESRRQ